MGYMDKFRQEKALISKLGEGSAHLVWVLALVLQESDLEALASEALTDGSEDKKIDFIHLNRDEGRIVIAQGYYAPKPKKDSAPANKASDLNTAVAWILSGDLKPVPPELKAAIEECRDAIEEGEVSSIHVLYVHNLPESLNVARELDTVGTHLRKFLGSNPQISTSVKELGAQQIAHLLSSQESHIEITEDVNCPAKLDFKESGPEWEAAVFSAPASWVHAIYGKFGEALFSANYRGFLGFSRRRKINTAIRGTAESNPKDFWVFNNGITILTLGFRELRGKTVLKGISVINGAQTTGAIGSVDTTVHDLSKIRVLCRAVRCGDGDKISDIVRFNNTQNEITTWDQYSGDPDQKRIEAEFKELGYNYQRKRGFRLVPDSIGIEDVAQPLAAFGGRYAEANRGRNRIFDRSTVYKVTFDGKKARHILFVYSLARAIDERRIQLKRKHTESELIKLEELQLSLLRNLRFKYYFISVLAQCLEPILEAKVDLATIAYKPTVASSKTQRLPELVDATLPVVTSVMSLLCSQVRTDNFSEFLGEEERTRGLIDTIVAMMYSTDASTQHASWAKLVAPK